MAEVSVGAFGAGSDVNTAGNLTEIAMAYLHDEVSSRLSIQTESCGEI